MFFLFFSLVICTKMNTLSGITVTVFALLVIVAVSDARRGAYVQKCAGLNCTECLTDEVMSVPKGCCSFCRRLGR